MARVWVHILDGLRDRRFWMVVGIVFLGRMAWFAYWGVLLEIDSLGYLELQANLSHPPLYSVFNAILLVFCDHLEVVIVGQSLAYSLAVAIFWRQICAGTRAAEGKWFSHYALPLALALEPLSGKLACTVMAETLFVSVLLLALALLPRLGAAATQRWWWAALGVGGWLGVADLARYAAPVFVVAIVGWLALQGLGWRRWLVSGLLIVLGFQAAILPLRLYYQFNFGTLQFNGFSSLSVWNTAAYLYPESDLEPQSGFGRSLATVPPAKFELYETWHTNQIFHDSCAYERYTRDMPTAAKLQAAREAGSLGWRLLAGAPLRHLRDFVWPNAKRPFTKTDTLYADLLPPLIHHGLDYQPHQIHVYYPAAWWVYFGLLLGATIWYFWKRKSAPAIVAALLLSCWLYWLGISLLAVLFLRFVYVLGPLIVIALGLLWNPTRHHSASN